MTQLSPYDDPVPRGWRLVQGTLRVTVALQCAGMAAARLHGQVDSPVFDLLRIYYEVPEAAQPQAQDIAAYVLAVCGAITLLRPCWPVLLAVTVWFAASAASLAVDENNVVGSIVQTVQVVTPLVLMLIDFWPPRLAFSIGRAQVSLGMLRVAIIVSLAAHGVLVFLECGDPGEWAALLQRAAENSLGQHLTSAQLAQALAVALAVNLMFAMILLLSRARLAVLLAALWGIAASALPVVADGPLLYYESLIRAAGAGAPLALFAYWVFAVKDPPPIIVPGNV